MNFVITAERLEELRRLAAKSRSGYVAINFLELAALVDAYTPFRAPQAASAAEERNQ